MVLGQDNNLSILIACLLDNVWLFKGAVTC